MTKKEQFTETVQPLMALVTRLCEKLGVPYVAAFDLGSGTQTMGLRSTDCKANRLVEDLDLIINAGGLAEAMADIALDVISADRHMSESDIKAEIMRRASGQGPSLPKKGARDVN